jgi:hypothetical protein
MNHEAPAIVPVDFPKLDFNDGRLAAYPQPSSVHDGDFSEGSLRGVSQNDDGCSQGTWVLLEVDCVQAKRFGGEWFHIYAIPSSGPFFAGKWKAI